MPTIHTNTIEGVFSILKRGLTGVYHQVGSHHLHRYLAEFDFRYNARKVSDERRAEIALSQAEGKRLQCGTQSEAVRPSRRTADAAFRAAETAIAVDVAKVDDRPEELGLLFPVS